jgi:hypothetical protein
VHGEQVDRAAEGIFGALIVTFERESCGECVDCSTLFPTVEVSEKGESISRALDCDACVTL